MLENYSGATRVIPIVGDPIAQVKSPNGMTRAFAARGHDAIVVPLHVAPAEIGAFLKTMARANNIDGFLATVPHKFAVFDFADASSARARILGSANVVKRLPDGNWFADMLDGLGFVRAAGDAGCVFAGRTALLSGAGGAGSAIALELLNCGVAQLAVHDTDPARRDALLKKLAAVHPGKTAPGSADPSGFDIVVNASPSGMKAGDAPPVLFEKLTSATFVGDVITVPEVTPLLEAARAKGCRTQTGVGMYQASVGLMCDFFLSPHADS